MTSKIRFSRLSSVNPALARPRIEEAVAARGKDFSACNHGLFQSISEIRYDPVLEEIGIHSFDDQDPQVAMTAATMLGKFGSPARQILPFGNAIPLGVQHGLGANRNST